MEITLDPYTQALLERVMRERGYRTENEALRAALRALPSPLDQRFRAPSDSLSREQASSSPRGKDAGQE